MKVERKTVRLEHPTEEGAWIEIRYPLRAADLQNLRDGAGAGAATLDVISASVVAWSEPEPVTREAIGDLDLATFTWLAGEALARSGVMTDAEKNASGSGS
jgi:hypothetical protein